jgi:hypothetical protein
MWVKCEKSVDKIGCPMVQYCLVRWSIYRGRGASCHRRKRRNEKLPRRQKRKRSPTSSLKIGRGSRVAFQKGGFRFESFWGWSAVKREQDIPVRTIQFVSNILEINWGGLCERGFLFENTLILEYNLCI